MISEIVCPNFYGEQWLEEGRRFTEIPNIEFERAADDGVCRVLKSILDENGVTLLVCRCGIKFKPSDGKLVAVTSDNETVTQATSAKRQVEPSAK